METQVGRRAFIDNGWRFAPGHIAFEYDKALDGAIVDGSAVHINYVQGPHGKGRPPCGQPHLPAQVVACRHGTWIFPGRTLAPPEEIAAKFAAFDECPIAITSIEFHPISASRQMRYAQPPFDKAVRAYFAVSDESCDCEPELHVSRSLGHVGDFTNPNLMTVKTGHEEWCPLRHEDGPGIVGEITNGEVLL